VAEGVAVGVAVGEGVAEGVPLGLGEELGDGDAVSPIVAVMVGVAVGVEEEPGVTEADPHDATNAAVARAHASDLAILRGPNLASGFRFARMDSACGDK
jgi:hypothetical protein